VASQSLLFGRQQKAPPKHALDDHYSTVRRGRDRTTILLLVVLILASGFVVGTAATFNASTKNAGNVFSSLNLRQPTISTGDGASATGDALAVQWTAPSSNSGTGYLVSWKDSDNTNPIGTDGSTASCNGGGTFTSVGAVAHTSNGATHTFTDASPFAVARTNYVDGRIWCYRIQTAHPYLTSPATTIPSTAWLSQISNPTVTTVTGLTLISGTTTSGGTASNRTLEPGTAFTFVFSQPILTSSKPTGTICTNGNSSGGAGAVSASIFLGMSGTLKTTCDPTAETLTGFQIVLSANPGTARVRRYNMGVTWGASCGASPTTCDTMILTASSRVTGETTNDEVLASGTTLTARGTSNTTYLKSTGNTVRNFCFSGTATNVVGNATVEKYRADPTNGRCIITVPNTI